MDEPKDGDILIIRYEDIWKIEMLKTKILELYELVEDDLRKID